MSAERHMARALELAALGARSTHPNPRVGCVIVRDGVVVGEGFHERAGQPHAEVHALRAAGERARGAEVYVTLEPCSHVGRTGPCVDVLIAAGVKKVIAAMQDPNPQVAGEGFKRLRAAGIKVEVGLLGEQAQRLNRGYIWRRVRGRPYVILKLAASVDGRTAMASGESKWITGEEARADVHRLRAECGAVMTSADTVLADDPQLNSRDPGPGTRDPGNARVPDRIVLDTHGRVPASARVWNEDGARRFWLVDGSRIPGPGSRLVEIVALPIAGDGHLSLPAALEALARLEVNDLLVECGPRLAGALLQQKLVDELVLYLAPSLLGHEARPLAQLPGLQALDQRVRLAWTDVARIGADLRLTAIPE